MWVLTMTFGNGGWAEFTTTNSEEMLRYISLNCGVTKEFQIHSLKKV